MDSNIGRFDLLAEHLGRSCSRLPPVIDHVQHPLTFAKKTKELERFRFVTFSRNKLQGVIYARA